MDGMQHSGLIIVGAGDLGQVVAEIALESRCFTSIAFLDDQPTPEKESQFPIIGRVDSLSKPYEGYGYIIAAFGNNQLRHRIREEAVHSHYHLATLIHPNAVISKSTIIEPGVIIREGACISRNAIIRTGCLINMGVLIDHCCDIGADTHIPMGCIVRNNVKIPAMSTFMPGQIIQ